MASEGRDELERLRAAVAHGGFVDAAETERVARWALETIEALAVCSEGEGEWPKTICLECQHVLDEFDEGSCTCDVTGAAARRVRVVPAGAVKAEDKE